MEILIAMKHVRFLKKELGKKLPGVKSSHRVEALARGLGWKSNAALRASLICGPTACSVTDEPFDAYLHERGFLHTPEACLSTLVLQMMVDQHNVAAGTEESLQPIARPPRPLIASVLWRKNWKSGLAGMIACLILFLAVSQPIMRNFMDQNVEQMLTSSEEQAAMAVLTLNSDMAHEAIDRLMQAHFVTGVVVRDDHGEILGSNIAERMDLDFMPFSIVAALEPSGEKTYQRKLKMPDGLPGPGVLEVTVDKKQAIAASGEHTALGLMLVAILGWFLGSHSDSIGPGRWGRLLRLGIQRVLAWHFSYRTAEGMLS